MVYLGENVNNLHLNYPQNLVTYHLSGSMGGTKQAVHLPIDAVTPDY